MLFQLILQRIRFQYVQVFDKYFEGNVGGDFVNYMNKDFFFLFQFVVMVCQDNDVDVLTELEKELWIYLDLE